MRTYIRQLQLVRTDDDTLLDAANTYLKASFLRTIWAAQGEVVEDSFDDYSDDLVRAWRSRRNKLQITYPHCTGEQMGVLLYGECQDYRPHLQGKEVPHFFAPGSYHALADALTVGWHPEFGTRLTQ